MATWDLSSYSAGPSGSTTGRCGMWLSDDGTRMWVTDPLASDSIIEYSLGTAWDPSTASTVTSQSLTTWTTYPTGIEFSSDGARLWITSYVGPTVIEFSLSTPWDVTSLGFVTSLTVGTQPWAARFKSDGSKVYVYCNGPRQVQEWTLSTPYDISTAGGAPSATYSTPTGSQTGLWFNPDGSQMYLPHYDNRSLREFSLSVPWDITSASLNYEATGLSAGSIRPYGLFMRSDGAGFLIPFINGIGVGSWTMTPPAPSTTDAVGTAAGSSSASAVGAIPDPLPLALGASYAPSLALGAADAGPLSLGARYAPSLSLEASYGD